MRLGKYSNIPLYALVKALIDHGYTIREAYNAAHYQRYRKKPKRNRQFTDNRIQVWVDKVKHTPEIDVLEFPKK